MTISYKNNKNIGIATATMKSTAQSNYKGSTTLKFSIVPAKAVLKRVKPAKKSMAVTLKKQKGGVKYQIQYRLGSGKWKSKTGSKVKVTVKSLKSKKKYTVRARAFKKVKGKTYYGKWSATKTVKIK